MNAYEGMPASIPGLRVWRKYFEDRGLSSEVVELYMGYIAPLYRRRLPVIFEWEHLGKLLGRTPHYLATAIASPAAFYRTFRIPKKCGGFREIQAPHRSLLDCQRWIVENILKRVPAHECAIGYVQGKSIIDYVTPHLQSADIFVTDISDFFPSIKIQRVIGLFQGFGYSNSVSYALASICCLGGALPQGAPTSPYLSNLICKHMDKRLSGYARKQNMIYTRYADDICFSSQAIRSVNKNTIRRIIFESGFSVNNLKTRTYIGNSTSKIVAGINLSGGKRTLPKDFTRPLLTEVYYIEKFGYISHRKKKKIKDPLHLMRLLGRAAYWRWVDPGSEKAQYCYGLLAGILREIAI